MVVLLVVFSSVGTGLTVGSVGANEVDSTDRSGSTVDRSVQSVTGVAQTSPSIERTMSLSLTPDRPGSIEVTLQFDVPDSVVELTTSTPENASVTSKRGFESDGETNYTWTGGTRTPTLTFDVPANRTGTYRYSQTAEQRPGEIHPKDPASGLLFADTGDWAIVSIPSLSTWWNYRGSSAPKLVRHVETDGPGVAGTRMAYLGPHEAITRDIGGQSMTIVVPDAAEMRASESDVFEAFESASESLRVGATPGRSVVIVAPTGVDWGPHGMAVRPDAWVRDDQELSRADNVWLHEYVHLRQRFRTEEDAVWLQEAVAEYFAASLALEQGRIGFAEYREHLTTGEGARYDGSVLTRPDTWVSRANYRKGSLVFGEVDRRLRIATDRRRSAVDLFRTMNQYERPVTHEDVQAEIDSLAGAEEAETYDRLATAEGAPQMWTRTEHRAAFDPLPPTMVVNVSDRMWISGPYRNTSTTSDTVAVPGETVTVRGTISNVGDTTGDYHVLLDANGSTIDERRGTLGGGVRTNVTFDYLPESTGPMKISIDDWSRTVQVREPATPTVTTISTPDGTIRSATNVTITVTVANDADRPAAGSLDLTVDGAPVEEWQPRLDVGQEIERTFSVPVGEPGTYEISIGERTRTILVKDTTESPSETDPDGSTTGNSSATTAGETTGIGARATGPAAFVVVFALLALMGKRRRRS
ncbi:MAG: hypothetical protein ACOCY7_01325 [Halodesulfurarchaeum sp.]